MSFRPRPRALLLSWSAIFAVGMMAHLCLPVVLQVPISGAIPVAACWTGVYFMSGPRHARRYWLRLRFVAANFTRTHVVIARYGGGRKTEVVVGKHAFEDLQMRMRKREAR